MKVLELSFYQPFAHFRNPITWNHPRTYLIPPRSTVVGMLQNLIGDYYGFKYREEWRKLKIAITGSFKTVFHHYSWFYKGTEFFVDEEGNFWVKEGSNYFNHRNPLSGRSISPQYVEEILSLNLKIYLQESPLWEPIKKAWESPPVLSLGRGEDPLFMEGLRELKLTNKSHSTIVNYYGWKSDINGELIPLHIEYENLPKPSRSYLFFYRNKIKKHVIGIKASLLQPQQYIRKNALVSQDKSVVLLPEMFMGGSYEG